MNRESIEIPLVKATYEELQQVICELQVERYKYKLVFNKIKKYIEKYLHEHIIDELPDKESKFETEDGKPIPNAKEELLKLLEELK